MARSAANDGLTIDEIPKHERALIRSALNALNRAESWRESDERALHRAADRVPRRPEPHSVVITDELAAEIEKDSASAGELMHSYWKNEVATLREALKAVAQTGRVPDHMRDDIESTFSAGVVPVARVDWDHGKARITTSLTFHDSTAAAAFTILRLSELSQRQPALLCCGECGRFEPIPHTVGRRISRFCSTEHRNKFNQREYRERERLKKLRAAKHK